jgi:predicted dehydrogenase
VASKKNSQGGTQVKVVVFGAGYWGRNYVRELVGNCVCVVDPDPKQAAQVWDKYGIPAYSELPMGLKFDGAVIITPPETHVQLALPLLQRGKYVLIEKPFATSTYEARLLEPYKDRVMAAHLYMYHPTVFQEMASWAQIHEIDHVYARRTNHGPVRPWQNALWDLAGHDISMCNFLFGTPRVVGAMGERHWATVSLKYERCGAVVYASWLGTPKKREFELVPAYGDDTTDRYTFNDMGTSLEVSPLSRMLDAFLSGSWERCTYEEGLEVVRVLETADNLMRQPTCTG